MLRSGHEILENKLLYVNNSIMAVYDRLGLFRAMSLRLIANVVLKLIVVVAYW